MISTLTQGFAAGSSLQILPRHHFVAAPLTRRNVGRTCLRAAAEGEDKEPPKLTFGTNANAARGYTEEDSAGQSNIFAVEPKQYVQGGSRDSGQNSNSIALAAGALGIGVLVVGLFALRGTSQPASVAVQQLQKESSNYRTLGQYKDQFASLQVAAAAPAVAEVQS